MTHKIDFKDQMAFENNGQHVEEMIFKWLFNLRDKAVKEGLSSFGSLIVLGDYTSGIGEEMYQLKPKQNPIKSLMMINSKDGAKFINEFSQAPYDGAIIVNKDGQILSAGVYLKIQEIPDMPDGCGTRHMAAASFSLQRNVTSVLTLSEETSIVRVWKSGKVVKENQIKAEDKGR